jgi:predicted Zn-dependent peptidase
MAQNETHFGRYVPLDEVINNVEAVTEDDVLELAESLFQSNRFALTLLGPVTDNHVFDDILSM